MRGKTKQPWVPTREMILERRVLELAEILRGDAEDYFGGRLLLLRMSLGLSPEAIAVWRNWEDSRLPRDLTGVVQRIVEWTAEVEPPGIDRDWLLWGPNEADAKSRCWSRDLQILEPVAGQMELLPTVAPPDLAVISHPA